MACAPLAPPPPFLGSGEIAGRYDYSIPAPKPLPWHYNQTVTMFFAVAAIALWVAAVILLS